MTYRGNNEDNRELVLRQLWTEAQQANSAAQRTSIVTNIVALLLRSRPLCHHFNGMPPTGVYGEIYNLAKQKLRQKIEQELVRINELFLARADPASVSAITTQELYSLQNQAFQEILDNEQLKKLAQSAQDSLPNSDLRSYALTELIKAIKISGRLCRPYAQRFSYDLYRMLYEEALTETFTYICLNIDSYDPERGDKKFMNWVNFKLDKFILKCYKQHSKFAEFSLPSFQDLEQIGQPRQSLNLSEVLYQYIEQDPEQIFQNTHIRNRPDANFRYIALEKFSQKSWQEIADRLQISIPTLSSFYNRWCRRFAPILEEELQKYI